jgi:uncharacterized protein (TIGR03083 family)
MDHRGGLRDEISRFHHAVGDLDRPVRSCPGWRVGDLVHHLGSVHRLFRRVASERSMQRPPPLDADDRPAPDDPGILPWAALEGELLLEALEDLDDRAPRWNFTAGPQVAGFIPRRMHHETAVHRWDVEHAYGEPSPIPPATAADGAIEYLEVHLPQSTTWSLASATVLIAMAGEQPVQLHLPSGGAPGLVRSPTPNPDLVLTGSPHEMLLAFWDREPLISVFGEGDRRLLAPLRACIPS